MASHRITRASKSAKTLIILTQAEGDRKVRVLGGTRDGVRSLRVSVGTPITFYRRLSHLSVGKRDRRDTAFGTPVPLDAAQEATQAFTPLKAVLGVILAIYGNYGVRL